MSAFLIFICEALAKFKFYALITFFFAFKNTNVGGIKIGQCYFILKGPNTFQLDN